MPEVPEALRGRTQNKSPTQATNEHDEFRRQAFVRSDFQINAEVEVCGGCTSTIHIISKYVGSFEHVEKTKPRAGLFSGTQFSLRSDRTLTH